MKYIFILLFFILTSCVLGQRDSYGTQNAYSVSVEKLLFYKDFFQRTNWNNAQYVKFEIQKYNFKKLYYSYSIGYGRSFGNTLTKSVFIIPVEFSFGIKKARNEFEIGGGITFVSNVAFLHLTFDYRYFVNNQFFIKAAYIPSTWIGMFMANIENSSYYRGVHDFRIGIGYQFKDGFPRKLKKTMSSFRSLHLTINPISYSPKKELIYTNSLEAEFLIWGNRKNRILTNIGMGFLFTNFFYTKSIFFPMSINYLYGEKNHFFEASLYHIYMTNSASYSPQSYRILQAQIGYRYQFNSPFFMRIAYAPYFRMADWKFRDGMEQSVVLGFGYRFHK